MPMHAKLAAMLLERENQLSENFNLETDVISFTRDTLSDYFARAMDKTGDLLKAYLFQRVQFLGRGVLLHYDETSKTVYLADKAGNIAALE